MQRKSRQSGNQRILQAANRACGKHRLSRFFGLETLDRRVMFSGEVDFKLFHDSNNNGIADTGDAKLPGWTVFVDYNNNGTLDGAEPSQITDGDGEAFVTGVTPGTWTVREVLEPGWSPAAGFASFKSVLVKNNDNVNVTFLNVPGSNGGVDGTVWDDLNGNGTRDAEDAGLPDWTVFIDSNNDGVLDAGEPSALTDASGYYAIPDLAAGQYRVQEVLQAGWDATLGHDSGYTVTVAPIVMTTQDFGNFSNAGRGTISGTVWNDLNADGIRAGGDSGLGGWTVFIDTNANSIKDPTEVSATTDSLGFYSFTSVVAGTYRVVEELQAGWNTSPGYPEARTISVVADLTTTTNFANWTPTLGSISGKIWNDANGDGLLGTEAGLPGWTVFIDQNSDGIVNIGEPTATTDVSGNYLLNNVAIGAVVVREVSQIGWSATAPGTGMQLVNVPNGTNVAGINFGNKQRTDGAIHGVVYVDNNKNGVRDVGERGLPGITVFIDTNNNQTLDIGEASYVTQADLFYTPAIDEAGTYEFTHLTTATYRVREITPVEQSATPLGSRVQNITLLPGEDRMGVNFGNVFRENEIHGKKFNDLNGNHTLDAGEPGIGGVTIYIDLDRNNTLDPLEPRTITAADGTYSFTTQLSPTSYVVRELSPWGYRQTFPQTVGGTLWPTGVSNPAVGIVNPTSITTSLATGQNYHQTVSLTLPGSGALTNMADVFLLFDDTGSFTANSPIVRAAFPQIISSLQAALPGLDLGFGVGRLEEYANFASEYSTGRPFVLNQPIVAQATPGYMTAIQNALNRTAPGYGGDQPETDIEALFQLVSGKGFDGNNNGSVLDSGPAGLASTQLSPGASGDVPSFASYVTDTANGGLAPAGSIGGAGFRPGALPIILTATDTGFAYQPKGETSITGLGGLTLPLSALTQLSRPTTPFNSGAGIQETVTGLNALGALVIGLGTNSQNTLDPRQQLESLAKLTGAINRSTTSIPNGTPTPIAPGEPLYFQISSGFAASVANGVVAAIQNAVTSVSYNITLKSSDPGVSITMNPGVVNNVGAGQTATFDVGFTGDGRPHRFDLQFVRQGTDVVLGSIPVVLGTPIAGDGYEFEDLDEGEIDDTVNFGNQIDPLAPANTAPSFVKGADQSLIEDAGAQSIANWATSISAGAPIESTQLVDFIVTNDNSALFSAQPTISADGTLSFTPAANAHGTAVVSVQAHDNAGTLDGGVDTSAVQTFTINVTPVNDAPVASDDGFATPDGSPLNALLPGVLANDFDVDGDAITAVQVTGPSHGTLMLNPDGSFQYTPTAGFTGTDTFTYQASDAATLSNIASVSIIVSPSTNLSINSSFDYLSGHTLKINFSNDVQADLSLSDLSVVDADTNTAVALQSLTYHATTKQATVSFNPATLPDGNYRLTIAAGALPNMTGAHTLNFFVLSADADHNRKVDTQDFNALAGHFGAAAGTFAEGDFDYSANVDSIDLGIFLANYGRSLAAAPGPLAVMGSPTPSLFASGSGPSRMTGLDELM